MTTPAHLYDLGDLTRDFDAAWPLLCWLRETFLPRYQATYGAAEGKALLIADLVSQPNWRSADVDVRRQLLILATGDELAERMADEEFEQYEWAMRLLEMEPISQAVN